MLQLACLQTNYSMNLINPMPYQLGESSVLKKWIFRDSNPGPIGYEPTALTN